MRFGFRIPLNVHFNSFSYCNYLVHIKLGHSVYRRYTMKGFFNLFVRSAKELKNIRCLCVTAMLVALDLVLKFTLSIQVTSSIKISFAFIEIGRAHV